MVLRTSAKRDLFVVASEVCISHVSAISATILLPSTATVDDGRHNVKSIHSH